MQAFEDPFGHVRNKEIGNEIITESIDNFLIYNSNLSLARGLDVMQCRDLAKATI